MSGRKPVKESDRITSGISVMFLYQLQALHLPHLGLVFVTNRIFFEFLFRPSSRSVFPEWQLGFLDLVP